MDDHLRDRQDAQIWAQIEANNFKQALKLVDKRLAKKRTDYLEALKIYIRAQSPQVSEKSAVLSHLEDLVSRTPPLTEFDAIELYDEALEKVLPAAKENWVKTVGELRWQCVKATPKNEDASLKCFQVCLARDDLDHARQIANSLEKAFPGNRSYVLWSITTMFLYSISNICPEPQKRIWGGLSFGQITKLANATRQATDQKKLPARSIQTPQEVLLLHRITEAYGKPEQLQEYLEDSNLGPESTVAKGEWDLWRLRLKSMEASQRWVELFETTSALLKRARTKNTSAQLAESNLSDWIVWEGFLHSAVELHDYSHISKVGAEIQAHLDPSSGIDKSWRRNASLALVKLNFESATQFSDQDAQGLSNSRILAILKYLWEYGNASTAYNDIRQFAERLSQDERTNILEKLDDFGLQEALGKMAIGESQNLSTASQITHAVNKHKLKYLLDCVLPEQERRNSPETKSGYAISLPCKHSAASSGLFCVYCLGKIAAGAIKSYGVAVNDDGNITKNLLTTDRHPADDMCVLASMCLIKLALVNNDDQVETLISRKTENLLRAAALLEYTWKRSRSNFQISLLLVRLYAYIGCGSLAFRAYQRLNLKQIQLDTLSYTFFDRLSSTHPHPFNTMPDGSPDNRTPLEHLVKQQKLYVNAKEQVTKNIWLSFKHGSYNSIFEMREVSEKLFNSMSATMGFVESRKILRLTQPQNSPSLHALPSDIETLLQDTNDYDSFPNFESNRGPSFEELSRFLPGPSECRYRTDGLSDIIALLLDPKSRELGTSQVVLEKLKEYLEFQKTIPTGQTTGKLTPSEIQCSKLYHTLAQILCDLSNSEKFASPDFTDVITSSFKSLFDALQGHLDILEKMQNIVPAPQPVLHAIYTAHEAGRTAVQFFWYFSKLRKEIWSKHEDDKIKLSRIAHGLLRVVADKASTIKMGMNEGGWIDKVLEAVLPEPSEGNDQGKFMLEIVEAMRDLVDENFMEEWAGEVVESWRESVVGFALLKESV